jgi:hypothetical protein
MQKKIVFFLTLVFFLGTLSFLITDIHYSQAQIEPLKVLDEAGEEAFGAAAAEEMGDKGYVVKVVARIINVFLSVLGIIFLILLIYSGALWMMAGGNEERITKAKQTIYRSIIGLIIIAASYGIATFVIKGIVASTTGSGL